MNKNVTIQGSGVAARPAIGETPHKAQAHGELLPIEPKQRETPVLPLVLRGSLTANLDYEESVERYGLWDCKILKTCWVRGRLLKPGDTVQLDGGTAQFLVATRKASIVDPRLAAESKVLDQAAALGLPTRLRELVSFAPKKKRWPVRPEEE